jgi:hypothetical protein
MRFDAHLMTRHETADYTLGSSHTKNGTLTCYLRESGFGLDAEAPALSDERLPSPPGAHHHG